MRLVHNEHRSVGFWIVRDHVDHADAVGIFEV
jgi:hypothetical protein